VLRGDLEDQQSLIRAVQEAEPDEVYNLAGISSVALSWREPLLTAEVTGLGLLRLLLAVTAFTERTGRSTRLVQASSAEIFGFAEPPQSELTAISPVTPYGAAKAFAHHAVAVYRQAGAQVSSVILYNHESPRRPENFVTRRITSTVARIARGSQERLRLGNLDARRDWGFAGDYAKAMHLVARHPKPDDFVVATGESRSVRDFVAAAFSAAGIADWQKLVEVDPEFVRPADPGEQRGDATKARTVLGWRPQVGFDELVAMMVSADLAALDTDGSGAR
jgi:GDPmannose 4,6-dehydratase